MSSRERNKLKRALSKKNAEEKRAKKAKKTDPAMGGGYKADRSRLSDGRWFLEDFCRALKRDLEHGSWETRHGAAAAIREVVRRKGKGAASDAW